MRELRSWSRSAQPKLDLSKAPADQRDAAKQKVVDLSNKAVAEFQEAQKAAGEKDPNQAVFWARLGEAYDLAGRNDEAINAYKQAVALKPDSASYYNNLGNVLGRTGKIDEAQAAYQKSAELDPPNAALAWRNFGISLYQAGRMQEAVEPLQKSASIDPKNRPDLLPAWRLPGGLCRLQASGGQNGSDAQARHRGGLPESH